MPLEINELADLKHEVIDIAEVQDDRIEFRVIGRSSTRYCLKAIKGTFVLERMTTVDEGPSLSEQPLPDSQSGH